MNLLFAVIRQLFELQPSATGLPKAPGRRSGWSEHDRENPPHRKNPSVKWAAVRSSTGRSQNRAVLVPHRRVMRQAIGIILWHAHRVDGFDRNRREQHLQNLSHRDQPGARFRLTSSARGPMAEHAG